MNLERDCSSTSVIISSLARAKKRGERCQHLAEIKNYVRGDELLPNSISVQAPSIWPMT
jgi:hypothetical protein